ncbi:uncharacterized protein LOC126900546 [Daktulosphaira vitifoliae]|uniref:uncharacterized protein LOC126900546 n=1 Tax=Daktulosphaira vitifoliae TaxID=58002 RepID=UPI0021AAB87E|nr:uncharacterized protein LOC126900546 [Daktulosphaira vitifoliae]
MKFSQEYTKTKLTTKMYLLKLSLLLIIIQLWSIYQVETVFFKTIGNESYNDVFWKYYFLAQLDVGVDYGRTLTISTWKSFSKETLIVKLALIRNSFKCCYFFNGHHFVHLIRSFFENFSKSDYNKLNRKNELSFVQESVLMIESLVGYESYKFIGEAWIIYFFSEFINLSMKEIDTSIQENIMPYLQSTEDYLLNLIDKNACDKTNIYNDMNDQTAYYKDLLNIKVNQSSNESIIKLIRNHKSQTKDRIIWNKTKYSFDYHLFSMVNLYLNRVIENDEIMEIFLKSFAELNNWNTVLSKMREDYEKAKQNIDFNKKVTHLGKIQTKFIVMLKIIILQLCWKHLVYINKKLTYSNHIKKTLLIKWNRIGVAIKTHSYYNKMLQYLDQFFSKTNLQNDEHLSRIKDLLKLALTNVVITSTQNDEHIKTVLNVIFKIAPSFYKCQISIPKNLDIPYTMKSIATSSEIAEKNQIDLKKLHKYSNMTFSSYGFKVFLSYMNKHLEGINFEIIKSFIEFSKDYTDFIGICIL